MELKNVNIEGETPDKMHLRLADITASATNLPLEKAAEGNDVKVVMSDRGPEKPYSCAGKFVPMQ